VHQGFALQQIGADKIKVHEPPLSKHGPSMPSMAETNRRYHLLALET